MSESIENGYIEPTWQDHAAMENLVALPEFEEVLETAVTVCLNDPDRYRQYLDELRAADAEAGPDPEAELLRGLGYHGLRTALELKHEGSFAGAKVGDGELDESGHLNSQAPLTSPHKFDVSPDRDVQRKIEAFGRAIVEEAFTTLGEGAAEHAKAMGEATDDKAIYEHSDWLVERIKAVQAKASENNEFSHVIPTEDDDKYFHPARLSPKLIGEYPDNRFTPTCLGASIMAASFYEKAGLPYLHAGVVASNLEAARLQYANTIAELTEVAEASGVPFPDNTRQRLEEIKINNLEATFRPIGYHAVTVARTNVPGHNWLLTDVNYKANIMFEDHNNTKLGEIYDDLADIGRQAPGTEMTHHFSANVGSQFVTSLFYRMQNHVGPLPLEEADDILKTAAGSSAQDLADQFVKPFFLDKVDDPLATILQQALRDVTAGWKQEGEHGQGEYLDYSYKETILKHVFPDHKDGDISAGLARCETDDAYRLRRAEDLVNAPFYAIIRQTADFTEMTQANQMQFPHTALELGMPHYRIGAAVLNDFALYTGNDVPPSFWISHWTSDVPVTEHAEDSDQYGGSEQMTYNNMVFQAVAPNLHYMRNHGTISTFLKSEPPEGNPSHE